MEEYIKNCFGDQTCAKVSIFGNLTLAIGYLFLAPASFVNFRPSLSRSQSMMAVLGIGQASVMASTFGRSQKAAVAQGYKQDIATYLLISGDNFVKFITYTSNTWNLLNIKIGWSFQGCGLPACPSGLSSDQPWVEPLQGVTGSKRPQVFTLPWLPPLLLWIALSCVGQFGKHAILDTIANLSCYLLINARPSNLFSPGLLGPDLASFQRHRCCRKLLLAPPPPLL